MPDRRPPIVIGSEKETLLAFLDYVRESIVLKVAGVTDTDARRALVPSRTSLLSLVQHLTMAEVSWFQLRFAGSTSPEPADALDDRLPVGEHIAVYQTATRRCNELVANADDLEQPCADPAYAGLTLRWVLVHMIEETARHAGHADILREQIDGSTGR